MDGFTRLLLESEVPLVAVLSEVTYQFDVYSNVTDVKLLQNQKASRSMLVTLSGMVIEARELQPLKAEYPMLVTLFGMVTEVREVQFPKASYPMLVTLLPMVTEVREVQP